MRKDNRIRLARRKNRRWVITLADREMMALGCALMSLRTEFMVREVADAMRHFMHVYAAGMRVYFGKIRPRKS